MAAFTTEQVIDQLMEDDDSYVEESDDSITELGEQETNGGAAEENLVLEAKIASCLSVFENDAGLADNVELFKQHMFGYIKKTYASFKPPSDPMIVLLNVGFNTSLAFATESKLWIQRIAMRLKGKTSIRNPYQAEIQRNMPLELFLTLWRAVSHTRRKDISNNV